MPKFVKFKAAFQDNYYYFNINQITCIYPYMSNESCTTICIVDVKYHIDGTVKEVINKIKEALK